MNIAKATSKALGRINNNSNKNSILRIATFTEQLWTSPRSHPPIWDTKRRSNPKWTSLSNRELSTLQGRLLSKALLKRWINSPPNKVMPWGGASTVFRQAIVISTLLMLKIFSRTLTMASSSIETSWASRPIVPHSQLTLSQATNLIQMLARTRTRCTKGERHITPHTLITTQIWSCLFTTAKEMARSFW